ncbi:bifunctional diguanylate cyclase/phosphodiesterase [Asanoa sp. WMMD1127]|uniref:putative bifunctional diguanylate cyclase/phosphodiesterase n=1 Tax=Asanoa sp. WMMD1127 TaxID=3016107 RepID=UPI002415CF6E|nr:bifunctional diguanylate cyclase/phosphodiesterase [Asanoa sp. WMMD1127]MDG4825661.1 bifunctional diguanylate cyclase/phosphodiesterase [Asanoa sp. WMMD1127]
MTDARRAGRRLPGWGPAAIVRELGRRLTVWHWLYLAIVSVIGPVLYVFGLTRTTAVVLVGGASVVSILVGVHRRTVRRPGAWLLIALSATLLTIGDAFFATATTGVIRPSDFPQILDLVFLCAYLPLAIGVLRLTQPSPTSRSPLLVLDAAVLTLAGSLITWILVLRPAIESMDQDRFTATVAVATLVGYVLVVAAAVGALITIGRSVALLLIAVGTGVFLFADLAYVRARVLGTWGDSAPVGFLLLTFVVACGLAAQLPARESVPEAPRISRGFGPVGLGIIAVALVAAPTALLVEAGRGVVRTGAVIGIVAILVAVLVVARMAVYAQASRRRAGVTSVVRDTLRILAVATDEGQVRGAIRAAVRDVLPDSEVKLVRDGRRGALPEVRAGPGDRGELVYPLDTGAAITTDAVTTTGGVAIVTAPVSLLEDYYQALQAMLDQAALALDRIDLMHRLQERERERYFRSIVTTSTDVILISQEDHIEYVSPSAQRMFGRDVRGERFDRLVTPTQPDRTGWRSVEDGAEGHVDAPDGSTSVVQVFRRDLTADPTVQGVVTTLHDVTQERLLRRDLERRANEDPLTGLANPNRFGEQLRAGSGSAGWAALFVDLDDFKAVNDTFGHQVGDGLLVFVARRIEDCVRAEDLVARLGGDEFGVLLRDLDVETARGITQRISDALAEPAMINGLRVDAQASIGLAFIADDSDPDMLMREADSALYSAKAAGKGRWRQYRPGMPAPTRQHLGARDRLARALRSDTLTLRYQPIVETATARPVGFEGLLRLRDGGPPMTAAEIIRIAESTGLVAEVGDWVLARALEDLPRLNDGTAARRYVSVNVAPRQLRLPDFGDRVVQQLTHSGARPDSLVLEITEGDLVGEDERAWTYLDDLRAEGVRVAIDDYGTGYASLSYLRQSAIDMVKVDGSFLADPTSARSRVLVETVADLVDRLGLDMVAEGVHDPASRDLLLDVGCRYAQGYHFARPMRADAAAGWRFSEGVPAVDRG